MGIFSDKCRALIDPNTGNCLTGEALEKAKQDPKWPTCGYRVKKAARRCSKCGAPSPRGWRKCPSCGKWVGVESGHCWSCGTNLHPDDQVAMADGHWQKPVGVLARRVDVGDVKQLLHKGKIIVEEGSSAILLQGGKFKDLLQAGVHTLDSLGRRINNWGDPPPRVVVMVDSGDLVFPIRVEDLRSSEDFPVELYAEAVIRLCPGGKQAHAFMENVFKDSRELSFEDFEDLLKNEIRYAVKNTCNTSTVEDLFRDPLLRSRIEDELSQVMKVSQERYGFTVIRVSSAEFSGKEYEMLRQKNSEVEIKRRQIEFDEKLRQLLSKENMEKFSSEAELEEYVAQLAQEKEVKDEHRDQELSLLKLAHRGEVDVVEAEQAMAAEMAKTSHDIGVKLKWDDYGRGKLVEDAKAEAEVDRIWLKVRQEKEELKRKQLEEEMNLLEGKDLQTLLAVLPEEKHASLLKLNERLMTKGLSQEQILALAAKDNPELAAVLLEQTRLEAKDRDKDWEERKKLLDEQAERLEKVMTKALESKSPDIKIIK